MKVAKQYIKLLKEFNSCSNCDESHPATLEFHHRDPKQKVAGISKMVKSNKYSLDDVFKEVEKCDILCSNCHKKTHYEMNHS